MEASETDKIEDALLAALSLLIVMNKYVDQEGEIITVTIQKLNEALERWREIEMARQMLYSIDFN